MGLTAVVLAAAVQVTISPEITIDLPATLPPRLDRSIEAHIVEDRVFFAWERVSPEHAVQSVYLGAEGLDRQLATDILLEDDGPPADVAATCWGNFARSCELYWRDDAGLRMFRTNTEEGAGPTFVAATPPTFAARPSVSHGHGDLLLAWGDAPLLRRHGFGTDWNSAFTAPLAPVGDSAVAYGDEMFLVVWIDGPDVLAARVLPDGTVLDPDPVLIGTGFSPELPQASFGGDGQFLVVWSDGTQSRIRARRVDELTGVVDAAPIEITDNTHWRIAPAVSGAPAAPWLVTWHDACDALVMGVRIDQAGEVLDATEIRVSPGLAAWDGTPRAARPAVAGPVDGAWFVAFAASDPTLGSIASYVRVGLDGAVADDVPVPLNPDGASLRDPSIAVSADGILAAWTDEGRGRGDVRARRFDWQGAPLGEAFSLAGDSPAHERTARVAASPLGWFAAWRTDGDGANGAVLARDGTIAADFSFAGAGDLELVLPVGDLMFVYTWGSGAIDVRRLGADGTPQPGAFPPVAVADRNDGGVFAAWSASYDAILAGSEGEVTLIGPHFPAGPPYREESLGGAAGFASDGDRWLLAWLEGGEIATTVVGLDGLAVLGVPASADPISVAWDGARYVMAWRASGELHIAFADADGVRIDADGGTAATPGGPLPRLACAAGRCAVAYEIPPETPAGHTRTALRVIEATPSSPSDGGLDAAFPIDGPTRADCDCRVSPSADDEPPAWIAGVLLALTLARATTSCRRGGGSVATAPRVRTQVSRTDDR
jgi:hypothetical protein